MRVDRALVVGAGIGGLAAGAALARQGTDVEIVEVKPDPRVLGVGINQPGNSLRALDTLGVLDDVLAAGFAFGGNEYRDWKDTPIVYVPSGLGDKRVPPNVAISRAALGDILRKAAIYAGARIHYGVTVDELSESPYRATVGLTDGRRESYDLVAAFDGMRSPIRRRLFGTAYEPEFTGCSVWRVPLPRLRSLHGLVAFQGDRVKGGLIPLSHELMYLLLVTPEPGNPRFEPRDFGKLLVERLAGFEGPLGWIRDRIEGPEGIVYSPLMQCRLPKPWHRGHVIVLGDAAHTAVPHLTQGAAMALEDAIVLADEVAVDRPLEESLTAVADLRFNRVRLVTEVSRAILEGEMAITAEDLPAAAADMRMELPSQVAFIESQLNAPYRSAHARRECFRTPARVGAGLRQGNRAPALFPPREGLG
jgi:2-polyprenyl-6-methoxyphenol hydroxylase-like FAD-dependent oxidoreductase